MHAFVNSLKQHAAGMDAQQGQPRWGIVSSVNSGANGGPYEAKVRLQPEDVLTGWLPVISSMVGPSWGFISPPYPGQSVFVIPDSGDHAHGVIVGAGWSQPAGNPTPQPPQTAGGAAAPVLPGEFGLTTKPGSYIRGSNDGSLLLVAGTTSITLASADNSITIVAGDMSITLASTGITINGGGAPVHVTNGDAHVDGTVIWGFGGASQANAVTHRHGGVQTGLGTTAAPVPGP